MPMNYVSAKRAKKYIIEYLPTFIHIISNSVASQEKGDSHNSHILGFDCCQVSSHLFASTCLLAKEVCPPLQGDF